MKNINKVLEYSIWAGLILVLLVPFIVPKTMFFPFITGKGFAFRILVEIIFGLYVVLAFSSKEYRPKDSWMTRSVVIFTFVTLVADIFGQNPYKSLWSNYERMEGFVLIGHLFLFYVVLSSFLKNEFDWKKYFNVSILASVLMSFYAVYQLLGKAVINQGGTRVDATFGNATYFAIYLVFHIFLCLYYLLHDTSKKSHRYSYLAVALLETIVLFYTATRGAVLGLIGGLVVMALYLFWKDRANKVYRKISYGVIIAVALMVGGFITIKDTDFAKNNAVLSRFRTIGIAEIKTQGRYFVWPMAIKGFEERPILGWGQEGFNYVFNKNYNPAMYGQEEWFDRSHNVFLDWLIAGGLLGFLSYVSLYTVLLYFVLKKHDHSKYSDRAVILGMLSAYIFHSIFVFDNLVSYVMFFSVLAFVHVVYADKLSTFNKYEQGSVSNEMMAYVVTPSVTAAVFLAIYFVNVPAYLANTTLIKAISSQSDYQKNLEYFKQAYSYKSFGYDEITEQLVQAAISSPQQIPEDITKQFRELAEEKLLEKIKRTPHDARYLVFAGSFYNNLGKYSEGLNYLNRAITESPNKQSILIEIGTSYLGMGNSEKMFEYFKKAYDLKPNHPEAPKILAVGAIYAKKADVLKEMIQKIDTESFVSDDRILRAYLSVGEYNSALAMLNSRIQKNPKDAQTLLTLASVYATIGQKQNAEAMLQKISSYYPEYKNEVDAYIKQLNSQ